MILRSVFQVSQRKHISEKMVKKKRSSGRPSRSSTCKTKRAVSQIASSKDPAPLDAPAHWDVPAVPPELQTPGLGQLGLSDRVYLLASAIFQNHHLEKSAAQRLVSYGKERGIPLPEVKDGAIQHAAYELAFNTLKCKFVERVVSLGLFLFLRASLFSHPHL